MRYLDALGEIPEELRAVYDVVQLRLFQVVVRDGDPGGLLRNVISMLSAFAFFCSFFLSLSLSLSPFLSIICSCPSEHERSIFRKGLLHACRLFFFVLYVEDEEYPLIVIVAGDELSYHPKLSEISYLQDIHTYAK